MRKLKNDKKVFSFVELNSKAQEKAKNYIIKRKNEVCYKNGKILPYNYTENDFEWFSNGEIMFYTNNENSF